jgi:2,3-bisphosphoglycerate-independent phosphoglycerate mutase
MTKKRINLYKSLMLILGMKSILILIDGVADRQCPALGNKTPLEAASTPNLDFLAENGKQGYMYPINEKMAPESNNGILAIFGENAFIARGPLEALGAGIKFQRGDLALRANFATINNIKEGKIIDRRVGRTLTTKEAMILAKDINNRMRLPYKFIFKPTVQHRGVLVIKGGFSDNITNTDPAYYREKGTFKPQDILQSSLPLDDEENTALSANIVNEFVEQSYYILKTNKINAIRTEKGLLPANTIITRDAGTELPVPKKLPGKWLYIGCMPLEIGISKSFGMDIASFAYPELKNNDVYSNLYEGLRTTIEFAKRTLKWNLKRYEHAYIHLKETDVPGHDNRPEEKKKMIEMIDKEFFSFLKELAQKEKIKLIITADHSSVCSVKAHTSDAVPFLIFGEGKDSTKRFNETDSKSGEIGKIYGKDVLKFIV